jgi:hypothetical protein
MTAVQGRASDSFSSSVGSLLRRWPPRWFWCAADADPAGPDRHEAVGMTAPEPRRPCRARPCGLPVHRLALRTDGGQLLGDCGGVLAYLGHELQSAEQVGGGEGHTAGLRTSSMHRDPPWVLETLLGRPARTQPVVATPACCREISCSSRASAGVFQFNVLRGRPLRVAATASISSVVHRDRSVPFGKY